MGLITPNLIELFKECISWPKKWENSSAQIIEQAKSKILQLTWLNKNASTREIKSLN